MAGLMEFRMQQHIAHEIYRQQMMQRIPGIKYNLIMVFFYRSGV